MGVKEVMLREFLKRVDLDVVCRDEEVLVKAFEKVVGKDFDAREFVRALKKAYFDELYQEFVEEVKRIESELREKPKEVAKVEETAKAERVSEEDKYHVLMGVYFVETAVKKPVPVDVLEKALPKLNVPTENLNDVLEALKSENLIEVSNGLITVTKDGKTKVHELSPGEKFREWKEVVARDESLKQLLSEQKRRITTLGALEE